MATISFIMRDSCSHKRTRGTWGDVTLTDLPSAPRALDGLRVLDLSRVLAGPLCGQTLGDHGAEIIKVEPPVGDDTRAWGPPFFPDGTSAYYSSINRNKRNICLDLRQEPGREVLGRLIRSSDIVIENYKSGTMARWGFDYEETLSKELPSLIYCRITGYGVDGPLGGLPGYDAVLQAYGGLMSINGDSDRDGVRIGVPVVDMVTGFFAFSGILLALAERERSGLGQLVDCTLLDTAIALLHPHSTGWIASRDVPPRTGSAHPNIAPYETFQTQSGPFFLSAANDAQFERLARVLGDEQLSQDPRFSSNSARVTHVAELREILRALLERWDFKALSDKLLQEGIPAAPVQNVAQALSSEQVRHREMIVDRDDYQGIGIPIKLSRTAGRIVTPPRSIGESTRELLDELGYSGGEVQALVTAGAATASDPTHG
jgi:crotonobetainyl-CoA:carnitine CoA-transferase CaiB-like acyl-CoA transferase